MYYGAGMRLRRSPVLVLGFAVVAGVVLAPAVAEPASAASIGLAIGVQSDGAGSFTPEDGPGADSGPSNGVVRTFDSVTYRVEVSSNEGVSTNETFRVTKPAGTTWARLPAACRGEGSGIDGDSLTCNVGTVAEGETRATPVVLRVGGALQNASTLVLSGAVTADENETGPTVSSPTTTVSAAPRYDLSKNVVSSQLTSGVVGPDGRTEGIALRYPIAVSWSPVVAGQGLLGFERTDGEFSFVDDVSGLAPDGRSEAQLIDLAGVPACGPNVRGIIGQMPGGHGGGEQAVLDSGTVSCTQEGGPGSPITVTASGVDTAISSESVPDRTLEGGPIPGGTKPYVVSAYITLWVPKPDPSSTFVATNSYGQLETTSISGLANFDEPVANNVAHRNLSNFLPGNGYKSLGQVSDRSADAVHSGSAKDGDPFVTPGQLLRAHVSTTNPGTGAYRDAVLCDVIDNRYQHVTADNARGVPAYTSGVTGARVEYAAFSFTDPVVGRDATCGDDDTWFAEPEAVPGGAAAVGKVRAIGAVDGGRTANLFVYLEVGAAANGTRVRDFGQLNFGTTGNGEWVHDRTDAETGAGPYADSVIVTQTKARVTKKIVDPGHDVDDTPDETSLVGAGNSLDFALYPTLSNASRAVRTQDLTVVDTLPVHTTYEESSASVEPSTAEWISDDDGHRRQRLTWVLPEVLPGTLVEPIRYSLVVDAGATAQGIENEVTVSAPDDVSTEGLRRAVRAVQIVSGSGVAVSKTAVEPVVVAGDQLRWELVYTNTSAVPVDVVDVIDVLPFDGDGGDSDFRGTVHLAAAVVTQAGERARYTAAAPDTVEIDGGHPSNDVGGSTRWCAENEFGVSGCPTSFTDVTGLRILRSAGVGVGQRVSHSVALVTDGAADGDRYTNRFGLRASNLHLAVQSNRATITVVSGSIGDVVWEDADRDGVQDDSESGVEAVAVSLDGTDDHGDRVAAETVTDAAGHYRFTGLRPGSYRVHVTFPDGTHATTEHAGDDTAVDSDIDPGGTTPPAALARITDAGVDLSGVSSDLDLDAGLVHDDPGEPGDGGDGGGGADDEGVTAPVGPQPEHPGDSDQPAAGDQAAEHRGPAAGVLAFTGSNPLPAVLAALLLVALGLGVVVFRRHGRRG